MIKLLILLLLPFGLLAQDLNSLILNTPVDSVVTLERKTYTISTTLLINKAITIEGNGATICWSGPNGKTVIDVRSSNVKIKDVNVQANYGAKVAGSYLIKVQGINNRTRITGFELIDSELTDYADVALRMQYVNNFSIKGNTIDSVPYGGIMVYSCSEGLIEGNEVSNITSLGAARFEAYGIAISTLGGDSASRSIIINKNIVKNVPYWEGIDTHGGRQLTISYNQVYNCNKGIAAVGGPPGAQRDINISNNLCDNDALGLKADCGIAVEGLVGPIYATGITIAHNTCIGGSGGIKIQYTKGVNISANVIRKTIGGFGIQFDAQNLSAKVVFNSFYDIMGTGNTAAIKTSGSTVNEVYISGNSLSDDGATIPVGGNKNRYGFRANTTTQSRDLVRIDYNNFEGATVAQYGNVNYVKFLCDLGKIYR